MTDLHGHNEQDHALAEETKTHHAAMISDLDRLASGLVRAAATGDGAAEAKGDLERWVAEVLVPHAAEEEATTYRAAGALAEGRLLIASMLAEHELIRLTARNLAEAAEPTAAGAFAQALFDMFDSHQRKENDIILPLLLEDDSVSLTEVMAGTNGHLHGHGH